MQTRDKTGRLLKYDPRNKKGNKDNDCFLVTKTNLPKSQDIGFEVRNLKPAILLHNLLDVRIIFKEALMGIFGLCKIIVEYQRSKSIR